MFFFTSRVHIWIHCLVLAANQPFFYHISKNFKLFNISIENNIMENEVFCWPSKTLILNALEWNNTYPNGDEPKRWDFSTLIIPISLIIPNFYLISLFVFIFFLCSFFLFSSRFIGMSRNFFLFFNTST